VKKEFCLKPVKRNNILLLLLLVLPIIYSGCKSHSLDDETAVKIYVENIIAEEKYLSNHDSLRISKQKIFSKYKFDKKQFNEYLKDLNGNKDKWENFFKEADLYLSGLKKKGVIK
jgi:hypothetical protein